MKSRLKKGLCVFMCLACVVFSAGSVQASSSKEDLQQQLQDASDAVSDLNNKKKDAEDSKKDLENQADSLTDKISSLNSQISTVSAEINDTEASMEEVQADIDELNESIEATEADLELQRTSMKKRIQYMYENQSTNQMVALLECGSITELLSRLEYMAEISSYDQDAIAKYEETQSALEDTKKQVEDKMEELTAYQEQLNSKKSELGTLVSSTSSALADTNSQISDSEAAISDLEAQIEEAEEYEKTIAEAYMKAALEESDGANVSDYGGDYGASDSEVDLLAALIQAEADNQGSAGQLAVGSVVMNRVASSSFPNTITGVIYQSGQFAPVASGRVALILAQGPHQSCYSAAISAISGVSNTDALFFCTTTYVNAHADLFVNTEGIVINAHYFYNRVK